MFSTEKSYSQHIIFTIDPVIIQVPNQLIDTEQFIIDFVSTSVKFTPDDGMNTSRVTLVLSSSPARVILDSALLNDTSKTILVTSIVNSLAIVGNNVSSGVARGNDLALGFVQQEIVEQHVNVTTDLAPIARPTVVVLAGIGAEISSNVSSVARSLSYGYGADIFTITVGVNAVEESQTVAVLASIASQPTESRTFVCVSSRDLLTIPSVLQDTLQQGQLWKKHSQKDHFFFNSVNIVAQA